MLVLSAVSHFDALTVAAGTLRVDAALGGATATVQSGGTLQGRGDGGRVDRAGRRDAGGHAPAC